MQNTKFKKNQQSQNITKIKYKMRYKVNFDLEFRKHNLAGKLIAIEGIDGSGKTTQAHELARLLNGAGHSAVYTKEPTNGAIGKFIREILIGKKQFEPFAFQYLFVADRVQHLEEVKKYLADGKIVVSDRFFWSSVAYGGADRGIDFKKDQDGDLLLSAFGILSPYHRFIVPDITFYLSASPENALERLSKIRHNADIYDKLPKLKNIALGYEWLIKKFQEEFVIIDANKSREEVSKELFEQVKKRI